MSRYKFLAIFFLIVSGSMFGFSYYIQNQIDQGWSQIDAAEKKLNQAEGIFSLSPATKQLGSGIKSAGKKKIASAEEEIAYYQKIADLLKVGGYVFAALGIGCFFIRRK